MDANSFLYHDEDTIAINIDDNVPDNNIDALIGENACGSGHCAGSSATVAGNLTFGTNDYGINGLDSLSDIFVDPDGTITPTDPWDDYQLKNDLVEGHANLAHDNGMNLFDEEEYGGIITDIIGNQRPEMDAWDIGAYEYIP
jgi:hypothetical protein